MLGEVLYFLFCYLALLYACLGDAGYVLVENDTIYLKNAGLKGYSLIVVAPVFCMYGMAWLLRYIF